MVEVVEISSELARTTLVEIVEMVEMVECKSHQGWPPTTLVVKKERLIRW